MSNRSKLWLAVVGAGIVTFLVAAATQPQSFRLTALTDILESLLLLSGALSFVPLALRSHGRLRLFWSLLILGVGLWFSYQLCWVYFEVVLHRQVPDIFTGDVILFLNLVPLMAALALRPHVPRDEYAARLGRLDFALLLVWWFYLYVLVVLPWQYAVPDVAAYNRNLNALYSTEKIALLLGLIASWLGSKDAWRRLYGALFGMSLCYAGSSFLANWAIARGVYYSGSFYDIPLAFAMAWLTWIGLSARVEAAEGSAREIRTGYGVWVARCSMIAVFSLPLFAVWAMSDSSAPRPIRIFRISLTLFASLLLGVMVFIRQQLLDLELVRMLDHSRESVDNLKRLQAQILQSEKLASIGQFVGGATHELNNPITAMLGYADLLLSTPLSTEQKQLASKIGQHVRRTKQLVASLISFAKQAPVPKNPVDLNTLARTAAKLTQPQWEAMGIVVNPHFDPQLPKVLGDSNQLLQVCLQVIGNCLHVMAERGGRTLSIRTQRASDRSLLEIATEALDSPAGPSQNSTETDPDDALGLSACQGILQEHHGQIARHWREDGSILLRVELPSLEIAPVASKGKDATVPVLWQSQPYA